MTNAGAARAVIADVRARFDRLAHDPEFYEAKAHLRSCLKAAGRVILCEIAPASRRGTVNMPGGGVAKVNRPGCCITVVLAGPDGLEVHRG